MELLSTKIELIKYATNGGLRMWYTDSSIQWHNLPASERQDWFEFFDICRDYPTLYTESIITSIMEGLCPKRVEAYDHSYLNFPISTCEKRISWVLFSGKEFSKESIRETSPSYEYTHLLNRYIPWSSYNTYNYGSTVPYVLLSKEKQFEWYTKRFKKEAKKVWSFKELNHAWRFIFSNI